MADVASSLADWSTNASSNLPNKNTAIGSGLADNLQQIQATVRAGLAFKGADIASGSTVDLSTATGNRIDVTHTSGTTAISSLGTVSAGIWKVVKFVVSAGTLTLTHNSTSLILPGGANITVENGDIAYFTSLGSGNWECNFYQRASGKLLALIETADLADGAITTAKLATGIALPPGTVLALAASSAPTGWLKCNGAAVSRTTYAALFAAIGTTFGSGDGVNTFNLPDLRGEFIRGWDDGRGVDAGRVFGSAQGDAIRNLLGSFSGPAGDGGGATLAGDGNLFTDSRVSNAGSNTMRAAISSYPLSLITLDASRVVPTANEVRPRNVALMYCIKY